MIKMNGLRKILIAFACCLFALCQLRAQNVNEQLEKANALYKKFNEADALAAYKQVLASEADNMAALVKCAELSSSLGKKQTDKNVRDDYYAASKEYADKALAADSNSADSYYLQSLAYANFSESETDKKTIVEEIKLIKSNADKGLKINPNHAMLNYMEGKWHYEMVVLNWVKKAALKTLYGKDLPQPDIDSAIFYMEKCRTLSPYFVQNYLDLAKAYKLKKRPTQELEVLTKIVKLPNRMADDAALKEEGKKMLQAAE